jgi:hypothetical protein
MSGNYDPVMNASRNPRISHEMVSKRAREIWEASGRPVGADLDHWLRAERELEDEAWSSDAPEINDWAEEQSKANEAASIPTRRPQILMDPYILSVRWPVYSRALALTARPCGARP